MDGALQRRLAQDRSRVAKFLEAISGFQGVNCVGEGAIGRKSSHDHNLQVSQVPLQRKHLLRFIDAISELRFSFHRRILSESYNLIFDHCILSRMLSCQKDFLKLISCYLLVRYDKEMCGLAGVVGDNVPTEASISRSLGLLATRGPDDEGVYRGYAPNVTLMHRRLSIQDTSRASAQPMKLAGEDMPSLVYNGEIYNVDFLRQHLRSKGMNPKTDGDTELLLLLFELYGIEFLPMLQGMFAIALWSPRDQALLLARDAVGQKPLFYGMSASQRTCTFASTPEALASLLPSPPTLNRKALAFVAVLGYVPSPISIYERVFSVEPGEWIRFEPRQRRLSRGRHYAPPKEVVDLGSVSFGGLFSQVVTEHLVSDVEVGLFLSGGIDSSAVAAAVAEGTSHPLASFTLRQLASGDVEADTAATTAKQLGLKNTEIFLEPQELLSLSRQVARDAPQPQGYSSLMTWWYLSREISRYTKVALSGDGGDELFGGYGWYSPFTTKQKIAYKLRQSLFRVDRNIQKYAQKSLLHSHSVRVFPRFLPDEAARIFGLSAEEFNEDLVIEYLAERYCASLPTKLALQRLDLLTFCSNHICAKTDSMGMAFSLEVRAPFLDKRIIDWSFSEESRTAEYLDGPRKAALVKYLKEKGIVGPLKNPKQGFSLRNAKWPSFQMIEDLRFGELAQDGLIEKSFLPIAMEPSSFRDARLSVLWSINSWVEEH